MSELTLPVPIFILEDDVVMQQRLRQILLELGYTDDTFIFAQSLKQAKELLKEHPISFALVDLGLPDGNGADFISALRQEDSTTPILVISAWSRQETILNAIQMGATGYILKERDDFEIMFAIRSMLKGEMMLDPVIAKDMLSQLQLSSNTPRTESTVITKLSARELQILNLVAQGFRSKDIAAQIFISKHTVDVHIKKLYQKLDVHSRTQAVHLAQQVGLI